MPEPINFPSSTPVTGLPLLVPGQAQKEFFVNQALAVIDALLMRVVVESRSNAPETVMEGACYRITAPAGGDWSGHADDLALAVGGDWHFIAPADGLLLYDRAADQLLVFRTQSWKRADAPGKAVGGTVVDVEVRAAVAALIDALSAIGVLGTPAT